MSTALVQPKIEITQEQVELIKRTVAKDATNEELKLYFYDCQRQGVHPLDKLIHFTKRSGKYTPITSIDFMRIRASETGEYAGNDDPVIVFGDDPKFPVSASVTVWRMLAGQRCPFTATARWAEYHPDLSASAGFMWKKMPTTMLGKCAEALALRKGFPGQLQGLYAREEMDQSPNEDKMAPSDARAYADRALRGATIPTDDESGDPKFPTVKEESPLTKSLRQSVELEARKVGERVATEYEAKKDYQEDEQGFASFTLTRVETKTGKNGEYRKLYWNGGSAQCFKAETFEEIDDLQPGQRVAIQGVRHKGGYTNFDAIAGVIWPKDIVESLSDAHVMPKAEITDADIPF